TLRDEEPLYGLAVVGTVAPDAIWTKAGARPGDQLYLTKPLGTGILVHARKEGKIDDAELAPAIALMKTLNREVAEIVRPFEPHTAGGLLIALPIERAVEFERALLERDMLPCRVGAVVEGEGVRLFV